ncbi:MAG: transposase [Euryarchaeota archaeon]|nr:transposase [Euryarchaeota archaeon]
MTMPMRTMMFLVLSYERTASNVHDSRVFASIESKLSPNVMPKSSLVDSVYFSNDCLAAAGWHGAVPLHSNKKNTRHLSKPRTLYQKIASFWQHWPNRAAALYAKRVHAETVFSIIGALLGYRLKCRSKRDRKTRFASSSRCSI